VDFKLVFFNILGKKKKREERKKKKMMKEIEEKKLREALRKQRRRSNLDDEDEFLYGEKTDLRFFYLVFLLHIMLKSYTLG
jgi:hypothetical protein